MVGNFYVDFMVFGSKASDDALGSRFSFCAFLLPRYNRRCSRPGPQSYVFVVVSLQVLSLLLFLLRPSLSGSGDEKRRLCRLWRGQGRMRPTSTCPAAVVVWKFVRRCFLSRSVTGICRLGGASRILSGFFLVCTVVATFRLPVRVRKPIVHYRIFLALVCL